MIYPTTMSLQKKSDVEPMQVSLYEANPDKAGADTG